MLKQERFLEFSIDEENWLLVHCLCRVPSMNTVNGPSHKLQELQRLTEAKGFSIWVLMEQ